MFRGYNGLWRAVLLGLEIALAAGSMANASVQVSAAQQCAHPIALQFQEIAIAVPEDILASYPQFIEPGPPHDEVNIPDAQVPITGTNVYLGAPFLSPYYRHRRKADDRGFQWDMALHVTGVLYSGPTLRRFHEVGQGLLKSLYQPDWKQKADREEAYVQASALATQEILVSQLREARNLEPLDIGGTDADIFSAAKAAMRADWEAQFQSRLAGMRSSGSATADDLIVLEEGHRRRMLRLDEDFLRQLPSSREQRIYLTKQLRLERANAPLDISDNREILFARALDARKSCIRANFDTRVRAEARRTGGNEEEIRQGLATTLDQQLTEAEPALRRILSEKDRVIRAQVYEKFAHQFRKIAERYQIRFDHNPLGLIEFISSQPHAVAEFHDNQFIFPEVVTNGVRHRPTDRSTWLVGKIKAAYEENARNGHIHSVEVYNPSGQLVGGLIYIVGQMVPTPAGLAMFHDAEYHDIGKLALLAVTLQGYLQGFELTKCENYVIPHMLPAQMGAVNIPRTEFNRQVFRDRDLGLRFCQPGGDFAPVVEQFLSLSSEQREAFLSLPREHRQSYLFGP